MTVWMSDILEQFFNDGFKNSSVMGVASPGDSHDDSYHDVVSSGVSAIIDQSEQQRFKT